ncbi:MAG: hypothetical protein WDM96_17365 [Lacunisphaera sp.]
MIFLLAVPATRAAENAIRFDPDRIVLRRVRHPQRPALAPTENTPPS